MRASIDNVIVAPMPTAAPLIAPSTGFLQSKIRIETRPPESRISGCDQSIVPSSATGLADMPSGRIACLSVRLS